jgi:tRNA A-37 threonylcarbamoyl transferase component Bud32
MARGTNAAPRIERLAGGTGRAEADWTAALASFNPAKARLLKSESGTTVHHASLLGLDCVIKRWTTTSVLDRIKLAWGMSRAHRHWHGAWWLESHGIGTARPYCIAITRDRRQTTTWLVMERLPGRTLLECLADTSLSPRAAHQIADAVGTQIGRIIAAGRWNRDHKPSNLLVEQTPEGPVVRLIDTVAIRRGNTTRHRARMLASLYIEPAGCAIPPRATLVMRAAAAESREWFKRTVGRDMQPRGHDRKVLRMMLARVLTQAASIVASHGDPTPRTNPLNASR